LPIDDDIELGRVLFALHLHVCEERAPPSVSPFIRAMSFFAKADPSTRS